LEETFKDRVQLSDLFRANQKFKHILEGVAQMPLEHRKAQGINHSSRKPVPLFDHPERKQATCRTASSKQ